MTDAAREPGPSVVRRDWRRTGFTVGAVLFGLAVIAVWRERFTIGAALEAAGTPAPGPVLLLAFSVVLNLFASGLVFSLLTARYGRVGIGEMQAMTAASTLLNYLPLRPGLFARIAWHRAAHGIRPVHSALVVLQAFILSSAIAAYFVAVVLVAGRVGVPLWIPVMAPMPLLAGAALSSRWRLFALAGLVRYVEILVWALRYHLAFTIVGIEVTPSAALAFASAGVVAMLVPLVPNGLGLREWAIGLLAPLVTTEQLETGMAAELVNRGVEIVTVGAVGGVALLWLSGRMKRRTA